MPIEHRAGGTWRWTSPSTGAASDVPLRYAEGGWQLANGQAADGSVNAGPSFARCQFEPGRRPSVRAWEPAPAAFWRFADEHLDTGLGALAPAIDPFRASVDPHDGMCLEREPIGELRPIVTGEPSGIKRSEATYPLGSLAHPVMLAIRIS